MYSKFQEHRSNSWSSSSTPFLFKDSEIETELVDGQRTMTEPGMFGLDALLISQKREEIVFFFM
jgi:hypothetical protein